MAGSVPSSPKGHHDPNQIGHHPAERPAGSQRWGHMGNSHQQMAMASRPSRTEQDSPNLGTVWFLSTDTCSTHRALTRSLVFDEEELQPLLEGVFIHIELDLHPAGKAPRAAHQQGGRSDLEPPRSPTPLFWLGDPPEQPTTDPKLSPGLPAAPTVLKCRYHQS